MAIHGFTNRQTAYRNIQTDYTKFESCLIDGQMSMEKGDVRYVITVIAILSISNLRNKSISNDDPVHAVFISFRPPTILTPKRSDICFILTSRVLAYPNLT